MEKLITIWTLIGLVLSLHGEDRFERQIIDANTFESSRVLPQVHVNPQQRFLQQNLVNRIQGSVFNPNILITDRQSSQVSSSFNRNLFRPVLFHQEQDFHEELEEARAQKSIDFGEEVGSQRDAEFNEDGGHIDSELDSEVNGHTITTQNGRHLTQTDDIVEEGEHPRTIDFDEGGRSHVDIELAEEVGSHSDFDEETRNHDIFTASFARTPDFAEDQEPRFIITPKKVAIANQMRSQFKVFRDRLEEGLGIHSLLGASSLSETIPDKKFFHHDVESPTELGSTIIKKHRAAAEALGDIESGLLTPNGNSFPGLSRPPFGVSLMEVNNQQLLNRPPFFRGFNRRRPLSLPVELNRQSSSRGDVSSAIRLLNERLGPGSTSNFDPSLVIGVLSLGPTGIPSGINQSGGIGGNTRTNRRLLPNFNFNNRQPTLFLNLNNRGSGNRRLRLSNIFNGLPKINGNSPKNRVGSPLKKDDKFRMGSLPIEQIMNTKTLVQNNNGDFVQIAGVFEQPKNIRQEDNVIGQQFANPEPDNSQDTKILKNNPNIVQIKSFLPNNADKIQIVQNGHLRDDENMNNNTKFVRPTFTKNENQSNIQNSDLLFTKNNEHLGTKPLNDKNVKNNRQQEAGNLNQHNLKQGTSAVNVIRMPIANKLDLSNVNQIVQNTSSIHQNWNNNKKEFGENIKNNEKKIDGENKFKTNNKVITQRSRNGNLQKSNIVTAQKSRNENRVRTHNEDSITLDEIVKVMTRQSPISNELIHEGIPFENSRFGPFSDGNDPNAGIHPSEIRLPAGLRDTLYSYLLPRLHSLLPLTETVPGVPVLDYPIMKTVPYTNLLCSDMPWPGFYADTEARCQVWHFCDLDGRQASFLCPNGTIFNQAFMVCDWWYNSDCLSAPYLYQLNERLFSLPEVPETLPHRSLTPEILDTIFVN